MKLKSVNIIYEESRVKDPTLTESSKYAAQLGTFRALMDISSDAIRNAREYLSQGKIDHAKAELNYVINSLLKDYLDE